MLKVKGVIVVNCFTRCDSCSHKNSQAYLQCLKLWKVTVQRQSFRDLGRAVCSMFLLVKCAQLVLPKD